MKIDTKTIKESLGKERSMVLEDLADIAKLDPKTNEWEAVPEEETEFEADSNNAADRFEDYEERSSTVKDLTSRLSDINKVLSKIEKKKYDGKCEVCGKIIEPARIKANLASMTCIDHK